MIIFWLKYIDINNKFLYLLQIINSYNISVCCM